MIVAVEDDRFDRPVLVPGISPKLSRTPGSISRSLGRSVRIRTPSGFASADLRSYPRSRRKGLGLWISGVKAGVEHHR